MFTISEMGRKKSNDICPKCGKQGYKRIVLYKYGKYRRFVHYDVQTSKRTECHIERILRKRESHTFLSSPIFKLRENDKMTAGEIANAINNYAYVIDDNLYKLSNTLVRERITDQLLVNAYLSLTHYLPLFAQIGHQMFFISDINLGNLDSLHELQKRMETRIKFKTLENNLIKIIKELIVSIKKEYVLLMSRGGLIDNSNSYRHKSNYKIREDLTRRLKSVEKKIPALTSDDYPGLVKCSFILYLSFEYYFIKYDFPKRIIRSKKYSDDLSEGGFGSSNFIPLDSA